MINDDKLLEVADILTTLSEDADTNFQAFDLKVAASKVRIIVDRRRWAAEYSRNKAAVKKKREEQNGGRTIRFEQGSR